MDKPQGKKKLVKDISANTLQMLIIQGFSLIIFYFTSRYLSKNDFGEFNWSMAVGTALIALVSLGLDIVFVKRLASEQNALELSGIHFFHTLAVGLGMSSLLFVFNLVFPSFHENHPIFFLVFVNLCLLNIANSFKLCLTGLEVYKDLAILAFIVNVFKFSLILLLYFLGLFTILNVIYAYIVSSALEFFAGYYFVGKNLRIRVKPLLKLKEYKFFIIESLPQLGVVFFDSVLARIDWIILGILSTANATAEYSFTYRMYESSKLPFIIIGPILLTRFSKLFVEPELIDDTNRKEIHAFFKLELFVVMLIPLVLICVWSPLIDYFTNNKYGEVNELNYMILAACVPLHCIINFLWSMGFAQGQLKTIMFIILSSAGVNLVLDLIMIPYYDSLGASVAFLITTILQTFLYARFIKQKHLKLPVKNSLLAFANAILALLIAKFATNNAIFEAFVAVGTAFALAFITRQVNFSQIKRIINP